MTGLLLNLYENAVLHAKLKNDAEQRSALIPLQRVFDEVINTRKFWFMNFRSPIRGVYLYGSVGIGKTYLMDLFFTHLPIKNKKRYHFHAFMQFIDAELRRLQGIKDPVLQIAKQLAETTRVLCLDEFLVHDVADALILVELLQELFARKIIIIATSNTPVEHLYAGGVHREQFLPVIALLKKHCEECALTNQHDYRRERKIRPSAYLSPLNAQTEQTMQEHYTEFAHMEISLKPLLIQNRLIPCIQHSEGIVWFDFKVLCQIPRCQLDYLEIAKRFKTVFLSNLPAFNDQETAAVVLFMYLIDVMYDQGVELVISAEVPIDSLYIQGPFLTSIQRTLSRLQEMQSMDYRGNVA